MTTNENANMRSLVTARNSAWSDEEWAVRKDLAAAYRLMALLGLEDSIYTHISVRVPGRHDQFLINPYGMLFRDVTASSLVKVGVDGQLAEHSEYDVNPAGFTIQDEESAWIP